VYPHLFAHGLRQQVDVGKRKVVAVVEQDALEGAHAGIVIYVNSSLVHYVNLAGSLRYSVVD
jgi:hypothetical protein